MSDNLNTINQACDTLKAAAKDIFQMALNFERVGNDYVGDILRFSHDQILEQVEIIDEAQTKQVDEMYQSAVQATGSVLNSMLTGIDIGSSKCQAEKQPE